MVQSDSVVVAGAIGVLGAAVAVVVMVVPRWSTGISWGLMVLMIVVGPMFGPSLGLPAWLQDLSPFTHVPNAPAVPVSGGPLVALAVVGVLLAAAAVAVLRRRIWSFRREAAVP